MLSAFAARPVVELKQRDKSKIEAILAYGDRLLVGLNTGHLRIYRFNESHDDNVSDGQPPEEASNSLKVELLREEEKFSRKPVQQLAIIKEANILVALSDAYVSFYDLQTYVLAERLERTKGASAFAVISNIVKDPNSGVPSIVSRLAVAVKRKLLVWTWRDMELSGNVEELSLVASVKSLTWSDGTKVVVGLDPGFVVVDVETKQIADVNRAPSAGEAAGSAGTRFGSVNVSGMGYMGMGSWVPKPMATKLAEGQLLLAKDVNTLFTDNSGKPIEKRQIPWAVAPEAIGYSYPYLLALQQPSRGTLEIRNPDTLSLLQAIPVSNAVLLHVPQPYISLAHAGKGFLVASDRIIWRMGAVAYNSQLDELVKRNNFDEAISLAGMLEDTLLLDKESRLREIRIRKAYWLFDQQRYRDSLYLFSEAQAPPARVISLYPESIAGTFSRFAKPGVGNGEAHTNKDGEKHGQHGKASTSPLEGRDLMLAVNELRAFLAQTRVQLQKYLNYDGTLKAEAYENFTAFEQFFPDPIHGPDDCQNKLLNTATLVDTTLFRAYMLVSPSLAGSLFRLDNFCAPEVVEEKLYDTGRYNDLIDFLHGKRLHKDALEMLEKFGKGEGQSNAQDGFRGPERTVRYLQQLPFEMIDLILQYAEWPLRENPELGMDVFLADTENAETLPRERVIAFLDKIDPNLTIKYLEHIVKELDDQTASFHERLISLYLDRLKKVQTGAELQRASDADVIRWRDKLDKFLQNSQQYNKTRVLRELPQDDAKFYESRAIVLTKLLQYKQALHIYVYQMQDHRKAEEYCNQIYLSISSTSASAVDPDNPDQPQSIYTTLLSLYLSPPSPYSSNLNAALDLLSRHGSRLPALNTLSILPTSIAIKDLESYFWGRMRAATSLSREEAVMAALSRVEKTDWDAALLVGEGPNTMMTEKGNAAAGRNRRIVIGENRLCPVCNKRFGRMAVRVWPDGEIVHYGCSDRR